MQVLALTLSIFFVASPAYLLMRPMANTCDSVLAFHRTSNAWLYTCEGGCDPGEGPCDKYQSGNPVGQNVPLSCKCLQSASTVLCDMQVWVDAQGAVVSAGCRQPTAPCGGGGDETPVCTAVPAPSIPPTGPVPLWDSCDCR